MGTVINMSRIRTIKPEFWVSEQIIACSLQTRLLFIGMWNFSDDNGVHPCSYVRLKAQIFPGDNYAVEEIKKWVRELIQNGLIKEYAMQNKSYWIITGWKNHQRIDKPTYRYPLPKSELHDHSMTTIREVEEQSSNILGRIANSSATEWKGIEGNGEDINIDAVNPTVSSSQLNSSASNEIFDYWKTIMNHPHAKLDNKRKRVITNALKLGYSQSNLKQAINGCANTPYNMGKNNSGQIYDDISLILRDADHIERFMNNANTSNKFSESSTDQLMAGVL